MTYSDRPIIFLQIPKACYLMIFHLYIHQLDCVPYELYKILFNVDHLSTMHGKSIILPCFHLLIGNIRTVLFPCPGIACYFGIIFPFMLYQIWKVRCMCSLCNRFFDLLCYFIGSAWLRKDSFRVTIHANEFIELLFVFVFNCKH